jgi:hypothetical protein
MPLELGGHNIRKASAVFIHNQSRTTDVPALHSAHVLDNEILETGDTQDTLLHAAGITKKSP